jgi:hypothetical protein
LGYLIPLLVNPKIFVILVNLLKLQQFPCRSYRIRCNLLNLKIYFQYLRILSEVFVYEARQCLY